MVSNALRHGLERKTQVGNVDGEPGEGVGVPGSGSMLLDQGAEVRVPVQGDPGHARSFSHRDEGDGLAGLGERDASPLDLGDARFVHPVCARAMWRSSRSMRRR